MSTTFVHIGDFHAAPGPRNADRYRALDQIIATGEQLSNLGAWLWPGDLNHGRMTIEDRNALAERLARMAAVAPVITCYGNHDAPGDLDVFARLKATWPIYVVWKLTGELLRVPLPTGEHASFFVVRYPTKGGLVAAGTQHDEIIPVAADHLDAIFMLASVNLEAARKAGDLTLMIGHVNVAGSAMSAGQPNIGHEIEIGPQHLDRLGNIYKGLNHIHKHQAIAGAVYAGSVCRLSWGEIEPKGYVEVDVADGVFGWGFNPIDVAPMYHVEGLLTRDSFSYRVTDGPNGKEQEKPASWRGCEVRARVRFKLSERNTLAMAQVHAEFAEARRLEVEPLGVPDRELRVPAVALARTLADKLAAYQGVEQLTDDMAAKLALLEHGDQQQILNDVRARLALLVDGGVQKGVVAA